MAPKEIDPRFIKQAEAALHCYCLQPDKKHIPACPAYFRPGIALALQEQVLAERKKWVVGLRGLDLEMQNRAGDAPTETIVDPYKHGFCVAMEGASNLVAALRERLEKP